MVVAAPAELGLHEGKGTLRAARIGRGRAALLAGAAVVMADAAYTQTPPVAPTREEIERPQPERVDPPRPQLTVEGGVERAPCALDRPEYRDIRFTLTDVVFEDLRGLPAEALRPAYAGLVGQEHPVAIICEIRDRAATILRDAGYVAAVEVPEQRIADGTVRFQVLMAKLVGLRVRGDAGRAERLIASYLEPLTRQEVFNRYEAERALLLAGDLPGYNVRLALRSAGAARGEVIGEVIVQRMAASLDFTVQNYGSRELGRFGGLLRGQFFGLTGLGDRTTVALFSTADFDEFYAKALATGGPPPSGLSDDERKAYEQVDVFYKKGLGYAQEMALRPQTLYGIGESPEPRVCAAASPTWRMVRCSTFRTSCGAQGSTSPFRG